MFDKLRNLFHSKVQAPPPDNKYDNLNPDSLFRSPGAKTFFYIFQSPVTGKPELKVEKNMTHYGMMTHPDYGPHIFPDGRWNTLATKYPGGGSQIIPGEKQSPRQQATNYSLAGRIGSIDGQEVVSFWNTDSQQLKQYLPSCLQELVKQGYLTQNALVSTLVTSKATPISSYLGGQSFRADKELTPEEKIALWQKLHLLPSDQKRIAMKRLGLGAPNMKRDQWVDKARELQIKNPENLTWRGTSESFREWLERNEREIS